MDIRAVAFDVNGTLIRILADEDEERIFRAVAHFFTYQGIDLHRDEVRDLYFKIMAEQLRSSPEEYPEFDAIGIWRRIIKGHATEFTRALPAGKIKQMPRFLAEMCRGISRRSSFPVTTGTASPTGGSSSSPSTGWECRPGTRCTSATTCTATSTERVRPA